MTTRRVFACALALGLPGSVAVADVITEWNGVLLEAIKLDKTPPPRASRAMAMLNVAMYDSVNSILRTHTAYRVLATPPIGASPEIAASAAARRILSSLYPSQADTFATAFSSMINQMPETPWEAASIAFGGDVADQVLALRSHDNANLVVPYAPGTGAGEWNTTPPAHAPALLPNWPLVTCWAMVTGSQLRKAGPPDLTSARYTADFNEVKTLGSKTSAARTADQTEIAHFWADGAGTRTPPGHWIAIAIGISEARGLGLAENARLFALLGITLADAAICAWDHKYAFDDWRPFTGIRNADIDGNPGTEADPAWEPLLATPPFPSYTSGHSTFSGSGAKLLALYFGTDEIAFTTDSDALPGVTRSFTRLSDAADEGGRSRIYGGIHWNYDNTDGLDSGRELAAFVFNNLLRPAGQPGMQVVPAVCGVLGPAGLVPLGGLLAGLRLMRSRRRAA